jgi:hypothetical protein
VAIGYKNETFHTKNIVHATIIKAYAGRFIGAAATWIMNVDLA